MGGIGDGYGSECHLLRYMGRHRAALDRAVLDAVGRGTAIEWLDCKFRPGTGWADEELKGLEFLADNQPAQEAWRSFWPGSGNPPNWDAVGWLHGESGNELLLVEAKAHEAELRYRCGAKPEGGLAQIEGALAETKQALGAPADADWLDGYYQYANRLATLYFLKREDVRARLVMIYFTGEQRQPGNARTKSWVCPQSEQEWGPALEEQDRHLGLPANHPLADRIHKVFLPVSGSS